MATGLTGVGYGWSLLSLIAAGVVGVGYYMPMWLTGELKHGEESYEAFFGCFRRCTYPQENDVTKEVQITEVCGRYLTFMDIPSIWWQICTVTVGVGTAASLLAAFISVPACCIKDIISRTSARALGIVQALSGVLILAGCALYPLGWDNREVKEACGSRAGPYLIGSCSVGWAFFLILGGAALLFICASLSTISGRPVDWHKMKNGHAPRDEYTALKSANI